MGAHPGPFDALLLSEARLGVIAVLIARDAATFSDLKSLLGLTQGNLGVHLRKLEESGYVELEKAFVERKPRSTYRITAAGRAAFLAHVEQLRAIAEQDGAE